LTLARLKLPFSLEPRAGCSTSTMPLPQPPVALKDQCTVIYNDVLYSYQPDAFQSLELRQGAKWNQLPMGVSTSGSTCVSGSVDGKDAFIVVGGTTSAQHYMGLQHYSFTEKDWQNYTAADSVAASRTCHGAAFLQQSSSILIYAGSQMNDTTPSSQTFLISTKSPYSTQAFSSNATPVSRPLMLSYNSTHALMLGGDAANQKIFTFGPTDGWHELDVGLAHPLKDSGKVQASIISANDGSKLVELFDMSVSPNQISTLVLQNGSSLSPSHPSNPSPGRKVRSYITQHHPSKKRKRETALANRPAYNSTDAPHDTRTGFSLANDPKTGLVVATGGDSQHPLAMFNETGNQWIDPEIFFNGEQTPTSTHTLSSSSSSSTPTDSAAAPPAAATSASSVVHPAHNRALTILGGVLGGIFGLLILSAIILLLLRYYRKRRDRKRGERDSGFPMYDKGEMDFRDVGADFMKEAGGSKAGSDHKRDKSNRSDGSATLQNFERGGAATSQSQRALLHVKGDSEGSEQSFWSRSHTRSPSKTPPFISAPIMGPSFTDMASASKVAEPRTEHRGDTGWSRYFTNNNSREMLSSMSPPGPETRSESYLSGGNTPSDWNNSRVPSSQPHTSAEVAPLTFRMSQPGVPPITVQSPPPADPRQGLGLALTHGTDRSRPVEPPTPSTIVSDIDEEDEEYHHYSHDSDGHDSWTPVAANGERESTWTDDRPISSITNTNTHSTNSQSFPHPGERVRIPEFPMPMPSDRNSGMTSPVSANDDARSMRNIMSRDFARTDSGRHQALPDVRTGTQRMDSTSSSAAGAARTFPRPMENHRLRLGTTSDSEDMSWLNLGTSADPGTKSMYFTGR